MLARFISSSDPLINTDLYLPFYYQESSHFLYLRHFVKRKHQMKFASRAVSFTFDEVQNDYILTLYNEKKTYVQFNTGIVKSFIKQNQYFPLNETGLLKKRIKSLFIFERNLLFTSHRALQFRNLLIKLKSLKKQYSLISIRRLVKPLNKILFFSLFQKLQRFSFRLPIFIRYRFWRKRKIRIYYLGFKFSIKNNPAKYKSSYFTRILKSNKLLPRKWQPSILRAKNLYSSQKRLRVYLLKKKFRQYKSKLRKKPVPKLSKITIKRLAGYRIPRSYFLRRKRYRRKLKLRFRRVRKLKRRFKVIHVQKRRYKLNFRHASKRFRIRASRKYRRKKCRRIFRSRAKRSLQVRKKRINRIGYLLRRKRRQASPFRRQLRALLESEQKQSLDWRKPLTKRIMKFRLRMRFRRYHRRVSFHNDHIRFRPVRKLVKIISRKSKGSFLKRDFSMLTNNKHFRIT